MQPPPPPAPSSSYIPFKSEASLAHRARIANLLSTTLKRPGWRIPFFKLPAHRIPTLWSLYRGLLKEAPTENIRWRVGLLFRTYRTLLSPEPTKEKLLKGHRWLEIFRRANQGDAHLQAVLQRYSNLITIRREKAQFTEHVKDYMAEQAAKKIRPIVTGFMKPTFYNKPLPRLKPQPHHISRMILKRRRARTRRHEQHESLTIWKEDLVSEFNFEKNLLDKTEGGFQPVYVGNLHDWVKPITGQQEKIRKTFANEQARQMTPFPPALVARVKEARREKVRNKTREREREARGEVLRRTILRRQQGPPAHVLSRMTERQKHMDKVSRSSVSEVGYVGMVKRKLGWKLKDSEAWKVEEGKPENKEWLDKMTEGIRLENERREKTGDLGGKLDV